MTSIRFLRRPSVRLSLLLLLGVLLGAVAAAPALPATLAEAAVAAPRQLLDVPLRKAVPDPRDNGRLYVITTQDKVLRSTDRGESWEEIGTGPDGGISPSGVADLEIDPRIPDVLYATPRGSETPLVRSSDGGDTWQSAGEGLPTLPPFSVVAGPGDGVTLVAVTPRVFRSLDRGETWTEVGEIETPSADVGFRAREPIVVENRPDHLYVTGTFFLPGFCGGFCAAERLYRSLDGGATWTSLELPFSDGPGHLQIDPRAPDTLYAVAEGAFYRSTDRGETWSVASELAGSGGQDLEVDPRAAGTVYRATFSSGVLRTTDGGATWRSVEPGFTPGGLRDLALATAPPGPGSLYAAGQSGLWALDVAPPVPPGPSFTSPALAGFRVWVRISTGDGEALPVRAEPRCLPETLCVSGAVPGRSEVFVRIVGPKPNGRLWPTLVRFTTSRVEVWIEQTATGEVEYYDLAGVSPGVDELDGLFDREGFEP